MVGHVKGAHFSIWAHEIDDVDGESCVRAFTVIIFPSPSKFRLKTSEFSTGLSSTLAAAFVSVKPERCSGDIVRCQMPIYGDRVHGLIPIQRVPTACPTVHWRLRIAPMLDMHTSGDRLVEIALTATQALIIHQRCAEFIPTFVRSSLEAHFGRSIFEQCRAPSLSPIIHNTSQPDRRDSCHSRSSFGHLGEKLMGEECGIKSFRTSFNPFDDLASYKSRTHPPKCSPSKWERTVDGRDSDRSHHIFRYGAVVSSKASVWTRIEAFNKLPVAPSKERPVAKSAPVKVDGFPSKQGTCNRAKPINLIPSTADEVSRPPSPASGEEDSATDEHDWSVEDSVRAFTASTEAATQRAEVDPCNGTQGNGEGMSAPFSYRSAAPIAESSEELQSNNVSAPRGKEDVLLDVPTVPEPDERNEGDNCQKWEARNTSFRAATSSQDGSAAPGKRRRIQPEIVPRHTLPASLNDSKEVYSKAYSSAQTPSPRASIKKTRGGISNIDGVHCYLHGPLQCLARASPIAQWMQELHVAHSTSRGGSPPSGSPSSQCWRDTHPLLGAFEAVRRRLLCESSETLGVSSDDELAHFKERMAKHFRRISSRQQQDAHEFLVHMLEGFSEEFTYHIKECKSQQSAVELGSTLSQAQQAALFSSKGMSLNDDASVASRVVLQTIEENHGDGTAAKPLSRIVPIRSDSTVASKSARETRSTDCNEGCCGWERPLISLPWSLQQATVIQCIYCSAKTWRHTTEAVLSLNMIDVASEDRCRRQLEEATRLDALHEEFASGEGDMMLYRPVHVQQVVRGTNLLATHSSKSVDTHLTRSDSDPDGSSIETLLKGHSAVELVERHCERCKFGFATKMNKVVGPTPSLLIIHINRGGTDLTVRDAFVELPEELALPFSDCTPDRRQAAMSGDSSALALARYELSGFVLRHGRRISGGHFYAYVRDSHSPEERESERLWRCFDDDHVTRLGLELTLGKRCNPHTYLAFYTKVEAEDQCDRRADDGS